MMVRGVVDELLVRRSLIVGTLVTLVVGLSLLLVTTRPAAASTTFVVDSTDDTSDTDTQDNVCDVNPEASVSRCTLRAAIEQANKTTGTDTINFNIPGDGPHTIVPSSALPTIFDPVTIDGYSQGKSTTSTTSDDARPNTLPVGNNAVIKIELSGANAGTNADGLDIATDSNVGISTVKGLAINRWGRAGVNIYYSSGNLVQGNYIGTDTTGITDLGNGGSGVYIRGSGNTIGGTTPATRNVISGNNQNGVESFQDGYSNKVQGNYIGTDATGTLDVGNSASGLAITDAQSNTVGGTTAAARNLISGNDQMGVNISYSNSKGNLVQGNYIGTDATGTKDLGNSQSGVYIWEASKNTIGGTVTGARNLISGNDQIGVYIYGSGYASTRGNLVQGNYIGTDESGTKDLGNSYYGVEIENAPDANNAIGGTMAAARNLISGNDYDGVLIFDSDNNKVMGNYVGTDASGTKELGNTNAGVVVYYNLRNPTTGNSILSNSIHANGGGLGIDLTYLTWPPDGVTPNDKDDADTGPNNLQNFPEITSAKPTRNGKKKLTTVVGMLNSTPDTTFTLQFFSNPSENPDEGKRYIGQRSVQTDGDGNATFAITVARSKAPVGSAITATATDSGGNTSEFSAPKTVD